MKRNTDINKKILKRFYKLLDSGAAIEECLEKFPGHEDELAAYASITKNLKYLRNIEPEKNIEDSCLKMVYSKSRIANIADGKETLKRDAAFVRMRPAYLKPLVIFLSVFSFMSFSFAGTIYASESSLPGDTLYSLKRASENIAIALIPYKYESSIYLKLLDKRLIEADMLLDNPGNGDAEATEKLISDIDETFNRCHQRQYLAPGSDSYLQERVRHAKEGLKSKCNKQENGEKDCNSQSIDTSVYGPCRGLQDFSELESGNQYEDNCTYKNYSEQSNSAKDNGTGITENEYDSADTGQAGKNSQESSGSQHQNGK